MAVSQNNWELTISPILLAKTWPRSKSSHLDKRRDQLLYLPCEGYKIIGLPSLSDTNAARRSFLYMHVWLFQTFSSLTPREAIYFCECARCGRELGPPASCSPRALLSCLTTPNDQWRILLCTTVLSRRRLHTFTLVATSPQRQRPLKRVSTAKITSWQLAINPSTSDEGCIQNPVFTVKGHKTW